MHVCIQKSAPLASGHQCALGPAPRTSVSSKTHRSSSCAASSSGAPETSLKPEFCHSRRQVLGAAAAMAGWLSGRAPAWAEAGAAAPQPLERFVNTEQGYAVDVPAGWERIEKMGANALFEDPARRSTSLGVTVNPVRVADITAFGSLAAVGEKLLDAERKKDGYLSVEMVSTSTRTSGAATLYVYEYDLDSTRGRKRILNTVTITGSRLYILNAMYKCEKDDEACNSEAVVATVARLRGLASSFEVV